MSNRTVGEVTELCFQLHVWFCSLMQTLLPQLAYRLPEGSGGAES